MPRINKALLTLLLLPGLDAATYWVSPTGAAAWASCSGSTPLSGTAACALTTANANLVAGDTVYLRGGSYSYNAEVTWGAIDPTNSGNCPSTCLGGVGANRITYAAYTGETPVISQTNSAAIASGIFLEGPSWIRITGITFTNFMQYYVLVGKGSSYNEIDHNTFSSTGVFRYGNGLNIGASTDVDDGWAVHNYVHHNYISTRIGASACTEGVDLVDVGVPSCVTYSMPGSPHDGQLVCPLDSYNTVEYNYVEYGAHSTLSATSQYNVISHNTFHNEPWIPGCTNWQTGTSTSSVAIGTGAKTFTTQSGLAIAALDPIAVLALDPNPSLGYTQVMSGTVTSYSGTTLVINVPDTNHVGGSGTYSSWIVSEGQIPQYSTLSWNGLYGHRNMGIGDPYQLLGSHTLVEDNRLGFSSINPNNGGANDLTPTTINTLARYNFMYGSMASGYYVKWPNTTQYGGTYGVNGGGLHNYVYNNTIYDEGRGWNVFLYADKNEAYNGQGIGQDNYTANMNIGTFNVFKNNLVYGSSNGDICVIGWTGTNTCTQMLMENGMPTDTVVSNWVTANGNPLLKNPDLSDPTSQNLFPTVHGYRTTPIPDLSISAGSPLIDAGAALTQAVGSGSGSTSLAVADALYFQDGTWGSDLARGVSLFPDWIAIGTVGNTVQISSVNYSTNTITLASPKTWSNGASVWLYKKSDGAVVLNGAAPDIGASETGGGHGHCSGTFTGSMHCGDTGDGQ